MAEQRKAAAPGNHNSVTHERVEDQTDGPEVSDAAKHARAASRVTLAVRYPVVCFDLSAHDLPNVTTEGTSYTSAEADTVQTLALKCGVAVHKVEKES